MAWHALLLRAGPAHARVELFAVPVEMTPRVRDLHRALEVTLENWLDAGPTSAGQLPLPPPPPPPAMPLPAGVPPPPAGLPPMDAAAPGAAAWLAAGAAEVRPAAAATTQPSDGPSGPAAASPTPPAPRPAVERGLPYEGGWGRAAPQTAPPPARVGVPVARMERAERLGAAWFAYIRGGPVPDPPSWLEERSAFWAVLRPRPRDPWPDVHSFHDSRGTAGATAEDPDYGYWSRVADYAEAGSETVHPRSVFMGFPTLAEVRAYFHGAGVAVTHAFDCRQHS